VNRVSSTRQAYVPAFRVRAVRQSDDLVDRTALTCVGGNADALIDACTITSHAAAIVQDEFGGSDFSNDDNLVVLEYIFRLPECSRNSRTSGL